MEIKNIHTIVIHCSATPSDKDIGAKEIDQWHKARGWRKIGYHAVGRRDGKLEPGRMFTEQGAHVLGNNVNTLAYCLVGGLQPKTLKSEDNFTDQQFDTLEAWLKRTVIECPNISLICGHRDFSPDLDGDGLISKHEFIKDCPCFTVKDWLSGRGYSSVGDLRSIAMEEMNSPTEDEKPDIEYEESPIVEKEEPVKKKKGAKPSTGPATLHPDN